MKLPKFVKIALLVLLAIAVIAGLVHLFSIPSFTPTIPDKD